MGRGVISVTGAGSHVVIVEEFNVGPGAGGQMGVGASGATGSTSGATGTPRASHCGPRILEGKVDVVGDSGIPRGGRLERLVAAVRNGLVHNVKAEEGILVTATHCCNVRLHDAFELRGREAAIQQPVRVVLHKNEVSWGRTG